ncbi:MAG: metal-dependent hydrolase [Pseudomonadota bacterium]
MADVWRITWLGHAGFRIETGGLTLLIDPWLRGNPSFDEARFAEATAGATHVLLSHGHDDHAANAGEICQATGAAPVAIYELAVRLGRDDAVAMNKGGTVDLGGGVAVTMVHAVHSSSTMVDGQPVYLGGEAGFMIRSGTETLYFMGDTDVFADMGLYQELHRPRLGIAPIGGHFTMDAERAAFACRKFFSFDAVIPCHYKTFPLLAQSAEPFAKAMAPTPVAALGVMASKTF